MYIQLCNMMLNTHTFSSSSIRFVGIFFGFTPPTTPLLYSAAVPFSHAEICLGLRNKEQGRTRTNKERKKVTFGVSSSTQHTAAQQARQHGKIAVGDCLVQPLYEPPTT